MKTNKEVKPKKIVNESLSEYLKKKEYSNEINSFLRFTFLSVGLIVLVLYAYTPEMSLYMSKRDALESEYYLRSQELIKNNKDTTSAYKDFQSNTDRLNDNFTPTMLSTFSWIAVILLLTGLLSKISNKFYFKIYFHCPNCYKVIYTNEIPPLSCPACNKKKTFFNLVKGCICNTKLKYFKCPHCDYEIDLFKPYNEDQIKKTIYES